MERIFTLTHYHRGYDNGHGLPQKDGTYQLFQLVSPVGKDQPPYSSMELTLLSEEEEVMLVRCFGKKVRVTIEPVEDKEEGEQQQQTITSFPSQEEQGNDEGKKPSHPGSSLTFDPSLLEIVTRKVHIWQ